MEQTKTAAEALVAKTGRTWKLSLLQEVLIVGLGYLVYSQVRGLAADRVVDAFENGRRVVELEKSLGIFDELAVQAFFLPHDIAIGAFNIIYFYGLFPLLLPTAIWLFFRRPHVYTLARNAFLASGFIAVAFYLALPTAPPRLLGMGFIDTLGRSLTPSYSSIPGVNPFAAVPSMHVGWNFLIAYRALPGASRRPRPQRRPLAAASDVHGDGGDGQPLLRRRPAGHRRRQRRAGPGAAPAPRP